MDIMNSENNWMGPRQQCIYKLWNVMDIRAGFGGYFSIQSTSYQQAVLLAMSFAMLEHLTEILIFLEIKEYWFISNIGLLMVLIGEIVRKVAVVTAGRAFTHVIRIYHEDQHQLVTHGVYRFMRHPGYSGFLIWAVGTQVMLCNPVSTVAFMLVLWRFFSKRIPDPAETYVSLAYVLGSLS